MSYPTERVMTKMSNSSLVVYTKLSPNNSGARTHAIDRITPHCVVGQCSVETLGSIFAPTSRQASCNLGIGSDGRVGMYVEEANRSWCTSSNANDQRAVTIECASDSTAPYAFNDAVYTTLIKLCVDICQRNGKTKLLWFDDKDEALNYDPESDEMVLTVHRWFANKSCPGDWMFERMGELADKVTSQLGSSSSNDTGSTSSTTSAIKQGSEVTFAGGGVYASSTATTAKVTRRKSTCKVTIYKEGAAHPCHCISTDDGGVYGWVDLDKCTLINNDAADEEEETGYLVKVTASALNIRKGPGTSYGIVGCIRNKGVYTIVETNNGWGRLKSGVGWIYLSYTTKV